MFGRPNRSSVKRGPFDATRFALVEEDDFFVYPAACGSAVGARAKEQSLACPSKQYRARKPAVTSSYGRSRLEAALLRRGAD